MRLEFGEGITPLIEAEKQLDVRVDFVPETELETSYLHRKFGNAYDFSQTP
jgi:hypothetical protein